MVFLFDVVLRNASRRQALSDARANERGCEHRRCNSCPKEPDGGSVQLSRLRSGCQQLPLVVRCLSHSAQDQCECVLRGDVLKLRVRVSDSDDSARTRSRSSMHMEMGEFNDAGVIYCRHGATNGTVTSRWFQALNLAGSVNFQRTAALQASFTSPLRPRSSSHAQHSTSSWTISHFH